MKAIHTAQITGDVIKVLDPVVIKETETTRRCFHASLIRDTTGTWSVRGCITHQRRRPGGAWLEEDSEKLNKLKGGEIKKLDLSREEIRNLSAGLNALAQAAEMKGAGLDVSDIVVAVRNRVVEVEAERKAIIEQLIEKDYGSEFWENLRRLRPDITAQLADAELIQRRKTAVLVFERELENSLWKEADWERFFLENDWIFGLGLRFQFLTTLQNQPNYGGADYTGRGKQKGDFLLHTEGDERFTVLVEIKRPETTFFTGTHRNGVPAFNTDLVNAISQVQVNANTWEYDESLNPKTLLELAARKIHTASPRAILVYGRTRELADDRDKSKAFELFRCKLVSPEIITFDELLARAQFIASNTNRRH